jgi:hypothetical protein
MTEIDDGTMGGIAEAHLVTPPAAAESNGAGMPALMGDAPLPARAGPTPRVLWPTELDADEDLPDPPPASRRLSVVWLRAAYAAAAFAGAFGAYALLGPRRSASGFGEAAGGDVLPVEVRLDGRADTLLRSLAAFDLRAQLFEARQMTCEDLARGLVQIDDQWIAYNAVRKVAPATLDSVRAAHDGAAQANVRAAERRFERSGCTRP